MGWDIELERLRALTPDAIVEARVVTSIHRC